MLQNLTYVYDPVGNIVEIGDSAQQTVFFNNDVVSPSAQYVYDAVYRLIEGTGREHAGGLSDAPRDQNDLPIQSLPHPNNAQALRNYTEQYVYDAVGNLLRMVHQAGTGSWTRWYAYETASNRLTSTTGDPEHGPFSTYAHDAHGNMTSMPHITALTWDESDQVRSTDLDGGGDVYYDYDAAGQRVRKVWEHNGLVDERIYLGGYEVYRRRNGSGLELERQTLHVMDGARRVAMVETKTVDTSGPFTVTPRVRYQLDNHLGSASLEVDGAGLVIGYEEYHPYGTTSYWSAASGIEVSQRRYRYTSKEKDEETGLYYYGARYYAPWLGRWTSADPAGMVDGPNLYEYVRGNPVGMIDPSGMAGDEPSYGREALQNINAVNAAKLGLEVETEEEKKAQLAEVKKTPVKVTKAPALPVQELRPEHPLAGDMEKVRRAAELSSIPPDQRELREDAAQYLRYGPVDAVLLEGEAAKDRIEAEIESLEAKEVSVHPDAIKIQADLEKRGVLPPRLTGPKGAILPGPIERDPVGGYRIQASGQVRPRVNLDIGAAVAFVAEGSPIRRELRQFVEGKDMVMSQTALTEFRGNLRAAGPSELARAERLLGRVTILSDEPSARAIALRPTQKVGANDNWDLRDGRSDWRGDYVKR
ncbi:RHS repeat-associated core domain-containing protein [Sorangium sp. So ce887]|uniref:RHS repeat-associated core domain-containing protein n=1 Tax=Sorangium sp. So ce887 TaxID=3133324 RepID=UPI003F614F26